MSSVMQEVNRKEENQRAGESWLKQEPKRFLGAFLGAFIYAVGVNTFLRPLHLYSGGFMGFSQLINTILKDFIGINLKIDVSGIIYYIMNIPGLIIAYRTMRRRFVVKTVLTVTMMTAMLTIIPIQTQPVLDETIANCLIAGIMAGIGVGLILKMGSCDGGMDLIGMIMIQKNGNTSVGRISIMSNLLLYGIFLLLFDIPTVIYSFFFSVVCSVTYDRVHTQNINVQTLIVTKMENTEPLEIEIMGQMGRGLTRWRAYGSYTGEEETILMAVISKYEIAQLRSIVHQIDPRAFVMIDEGVGIDGHFVKKIT